MIRVGALDDHFMILEGLKGMLEENPEIDLRFTVSDPWIAETQLIENPVAVLLLDIHLDDEDGIEWCQKWKKQFPDLKIIGLSNLHQAAIIKNMLKLGASGYLLKNTGKEELILALKTVASGQQYLPQNIVKTLLDESIYGHSNQGTYVPKLTRREKEILKLIADEHTTSEISAILHISTDTVETHRSNLLQKIGARNSAGLIRMAMEKGLI